MIGVFGARGFVGTGVCEELEVAGDHFVRLGRVSLPALAVAEHVWSLVSAHQAEILELNEELLRELLSVDVVINSAGLAAPTETEYEPLWKTNVLLPAVVDVLCREAGVAHVVHVSSAAVQGHLNPLNEAREWVGQSPYAKSKIAAEELLLDGAGVSTSIYRATSVVGPGRKIVESLIGFYGGRLAPVFGDGSARLPLSALPNTAAAIVALVRSRQTGIFLQPWEGATQSTIADALASNDTRLLSLPAPQFLETLTNRIGEFGGPLTPFVRRAELLIFGQGQDATAMSSTGYEPRVDFIDYIAQLAEDLR